MNFPNEQFWSNMHFYSKSVFDFLMRMEISSASFVRHPKRFLAAFSSLSDVFSLILLCMHPIHTAGLPSSWAAFKVFPLPGMPCPLVLCSANIYWANSWCPLEEFSWRSQFFSLPFGTPSWWGHSGQICLQQEALWERPFMQRSFQEAL